MSEAERVLIPEELFYYDDPSAPVPNVRLSPGVSAVIFDSQRRILFMKRTRGEYWSLPGGALVLMAVTLSIPPLIPVIEAIFDALPDPD